jgi:hypothetical protein
MRCKLVILRVSKTAIITSWAPSNSAVRVQLNATNKKLVNEMNGL